MKVLSRLSGLAAKLLRFLRPSGPPPAPSAARRLPTGEAERKLTRSAQTKEPAPQETAWETPSPGPRRPPRAVARNLIVGVDFGTSTTKVAWHDTTEDRFEVFRWGPEQAGIESALLPSLIAVRDQQIWFGHQAAELSNPDLRLPWIKICVLCERNQEICRRCSHSPERGTVALGSHTRVSARALAALFLSHVIGSVERGLLSRYSGENVTIQWNVGCPMDHIDSLKAHALYEAMVYLAWELRSGVPNPIGLDAACAAEAVLLDLQVPEDSERVIQVRPETHAGVMAFLQSPHAEEGTYVIVDVGAGTTEISMFLHGRDRSQRGDPFPFFSNYLNDGSFPVGGGDVDRELAKKWAVDIETARQRKECVDDLRVQLETVDKIFQRYRFVCGKVVADRGLPPQQCKYDLFTLGGGSRLKAVQRILRCDLQYPPLEARRFERVRPPRNFVRFDGLDSNFDLLAVACGLASTMFWDVRRPAETGPMEPPAPPRQIADRDEQYPK